MSIWLSQLFCPQRHTTSTVIDGELRCAICGSDDLTSEYQELPYATLDEATTALLAEARRDRLARELINHASRN